MNPQPPRPQDASTRPQARDPVLAALREACNRRDRADPGIRILLAYARELAAPRPYRLADLAAVTGMSISGIRTAYDCRDVDAARRILHAAGPVQDAAGRHRDGAHD